MTIDQLAPGQKIELEVIIGTSSFIVKSTVIGTSNAKAILVDAYKYNGATVDFSSPKLKNTIFNLHYIDQLNLGRYVWNNVSVKMVSYKDKDYYAIETRPFGANSKSSERRESDRLKLDTPGRAIINSNSIDIEPVDISDSGFAFYASDQIASVGEYIMVQFSDRVSDTDFDMVLTLRLVRYEPREGKYFYAGVITDKPDKMLAYLCFKRIGTQISKNTKEEPT